MYPKPPDITPEQRESIRYWLDIAGSEGKGCRSEPKRVVYSLKDYETLDYHDITAMGDTFVRKVASVVVKPGASHIPGLGKDEKRESNK